MQRGKQRTAYSDMTDFFILLFELSLLKHYAITTLEAKVQKPLITKEKLLVIAILYLQL